MDATSIIITVVCSIIGSAGLFSFVQFIINRHDKRNDDLKEIKKDLDNIKKVQAETILRVTRNELNGLIHDDPRNTEAILQVAQYYFNDLKGDAYAHGKMERWSRDYGVPVDFIFKK